MYLRVCGPTQEKKEAFPFPTHFVRIIQHTPSVPALLASARFFEAKGGKRYKKKIPRGEDSKANDRLTQAQKVYIPGKREKAHFKSFAYPPKEEAPFSCIIACCAAPCRTSQSMTPFDHVPPFKKADCGPSSRIKWKKKTTGRKKNYKSLKLCLAREESIPVHTRTTRDPCGDVGGTGAIDIEL